MSEQTNRVLEEMSDIQRTAFDHRMGGLYIKAQQNPESNANAAGKTYAQYREIILNNIGDSLDPANKFKHLDKIANEIADEGSSFAHRHR
jgi:hypothetical protein